MNIENLKNESLASIHGAQDLRALDEVKVQLMGKQGVISNLLKTLGALSPEERKEKGALFNVVREDVTQALEARRQDLEAKAISDKLKNETLDMTLTARPEVQGSVHPLAQASFEAIEILKSMGFVIAEGPDMEEDFYNFTALNIPESHPARQEADTFYLPESNGVSRLLRTHTSPVQIRTMMEKKPPLRIIVPGRVYRSDYDQTHTPNFHQIEGLYIAKDLHMGHLKGCLIQFLRQFFEVPDLNVRFRPSYFPFTEPSAEVDVACTRTAKELVIGGEGGWLEILGCGMVHPNVLRHCGIDPDVYQGFAFGMGIERIAMLKYAIPDLRSFYDTDMRWLRHYGFSACQAMMAGGAR